MRSNKLISGLTFLVVAVSLFAAPLQLSARSAQRSSPLVARAEQVTGDRFRIQTSTPRGVTVIAVTLRVLRSWPLSIAGSQNSLRWPAAMGIRVI